MARSRSIGTRRIGKAGGQEDWDMTPDGYVAQLLGWLDTNGCQQQINADDPLKAA